MATLTIDGNTAAARVTLKKAGWLYAGTTQTWSRKIDQYWVDQIAGGETRKAALKSLQGLKKGCRVTLDSEEVFVSATYGASATYGGSAVASHHASAAYGTDNRDAAGVYVPSARIPGSSPDDLV